MYWSVASILLIDKKIIFWSRWYVFNIHIKSRSGEGQLMLAWLWVPLRKQCQAVEGQEWDQAMSSSSEKEEDMEKTPDSDSLLACCKSDKTTKQSQWAFWRNEVAKMKHWTKNQPKNETKTNTKQTDVCHVSQEWEVITLTRLRSLRWTLDGLGALLANGGRA